ncbi:MAG TPA: DUF1343 domain-containing protein [Vicinamibacterales bacterium]|jgi:uncharacterized protein YbbC (DUF1343 family)|nr:DUF1343 domain-containing protein [Vicinamibacterales bacterium]
MPSSVHAERRTVRLGIDALLDGHRRLVKGRRVGVVCNPASVDMQFRHTADRLSAHPDVQLAAIFGPQHGFRSDLQDNMIETPHAHDARRRVPVYSLYSETREPTADMLSTLDALVIDLQDVGTRVYTYIYTMANCMRAAARHGVPVIVCDRPNPVGGDAVEGATLRPEFASFVGQFPIPLRHGMTIGELARLFNDAFGLNAALEVVPLEGWQRSMYYDETALPWIIPSPNLPTLDSTIVYPGAVLFEGTMLSEGRGTTRPFELIGAPWIDGDRLAEAMNGHGLPGVYFRPAFFEPTFQKHARETCGGCQIHVLDRRGFEPVRTAVELIAEFRRQDPERFAWRQPPYEYEREKPPIDILYGSDRLRVTIDGGGNAAALASEWAADAATFRRQREKYLLY